MPIPAGAGVVSSVIHFALGSPIDNPWIALVWLCLLLFTSFLMVSNWRFWSAKGDHCRSTSSLPALYADCVIGALIVLYPSTYDHRRWRAHLVSG